MKKKTNYVCIFKRLVIQMDTVMQVEPQLNCIGGNGIKLILNL